MVAAAAGQLESVDAFLGVGADVDARRRDGFRSAHLCVKRQTAIFVFFARAALVEWPIVSGTAFTRANDAETESDLRFSLGFENG